MQGHVSALVCNVGDRVICGCAVVDVILSRVSGRVRRGALVVCQDELLLGELAREGEEIPLFDVSEIRDEGPEHMVISLRGGRMHELVWVPDLRTTHDAISMAQLINALRAEAPEPALRTLGHTPASQLASLPIPASASVRRIPIPLMPLRQSGHAGSLAWPEGLSEAVYLAFWDNYVNQVSGAQRAVACHEAVTVDLFHAYLCDFTLRVNMTAVGHRTERFLASPAFMQAAAQHADGGASAGRDTSVCLATASGAPLRVPLPAWAAFVKRWNADHSLRRKVCVKSADVRKAPPSAQQPHRGADHAGGGGAGLPRAAHMSLMIQAR